MPLIQQDSLSLVVGRGSNAKLLLRLANAEVPVSLGDGQSGSPGAPKQWRGVDHQILGIFEQILGISASNHGVRL